MKKPERLKLKEINKAAVILKEGGVVVFPTDTVFGIGCAISQKAATARIYKVKGRSTDQKFPILVSSIQQAEDLAHLNDNARNIIKKYWPGALTVVAKSKIDGQTIGIRMPDSQTARKLIELVGEPIIGTSANFHSQPSVSKESELDKNLLKLVDYKIGGDCELKVESTVVDVTSEEIKILRQGAIKL